MGIDKLSDASGFEKIKLLVMDCDGVLTDGRLFFTVSGETIKVFNVRDGQGLVMWHAAGGISAIISGRDSGGIIEKRAEELGIEYVRTNSMDKAADLRRILTASGLKAEETAYMGDDVGDIAVLNIVGLPIAVADAAEEILPHCSIVTKAAGGEGAVREVIDKLLAAKNKSDQ